MINTLKIIGEILRLAKDSDLYKGYIKGNLDIKLLLIILKPNKKILSITNLVIL